jgi:hypothetical protein
MVTAEVQDQQQRLIDEDAQDKSQDNTRLKSNEIGDVPQGWPSSPRPVEAPHLFNIITNAVVDLSSIALSVIFLAFALLVVQYDHTETALRPGLTKALLNASIYVREPMRPICCSGS